MFSANFTMGLIFSEGYW